MESYPKRRRKSEGPRGDSVGVVAGESMPELDSYGHRLMVVGPITFCITCGCYASNIAQGLKLACQGKPLGKSNRDVQRRKKRLRLLAGLHPTTQVALPDLTAVDLARMQAWGRRLAEVQEEADEVTEAGDDHGPPRKRLGVGRNATHATAGQNG